MVLKHCTVIEILWKRKRFSHSSSLDELIQRPRAWRKSMARAVKNAGIFNRNWLEKIWLQQHWIFSDFPYCCLRGWSSSLPRRRVHIGVRQSADRRYISCHGSLTWDVNKFADINSIHFLIRNINYWQMIWYIGNKNNWVIVVKIINKNIINQRWTCCTEPSWSSNNWKTLSRKNIVD